MASEKKLYSASTHSSVEALIPPHPAAKDRKSPKEIYHWRLFFLVFIFSIIGVGRIYDEANIYGSIAQTSFMMKFFAKKTKLEVAYIVSNLQPCVQFGSIGGALMAAFSLDKLGKVRALQGSCIIWILGVVLQITSPALPQLYAGRIIEGLAVGYGSAIGPLYLAEIAPPAHRGMFVGFYASSGYFGYFISYAANYGTAKNLSPLDKNTWIIPTAIKIVFPAIAFLGSFLCFESPRSLFLKGDVVKATENMCKLRNLPENHPYVLSEIADIQQSLISESHINYSIGRKFKELVANHAIRYRFWLISITVQSFAQASGHTAPLLYTQQIWFNLGIKGADQTRMMMYYGLVKFITATLATIFVIDFIGRRKSLFVGYTTQAIGLLIFGIFLHAVPQAQIPGAPLTSSQKSGARFATAGMFFAGIGWTIGANAVQFVYPAEVFPYGIRTFAHSLVMAFNFLSEYGDFRIVEEMQVPFDQFGIFYFFFAVCFSSLVWTYVFLPDTTGRSLDSMDEIFHVPIFQVGRKGATLCPDTTEIARFATGISRSNTRGVVETTIDKPTVDQIEHV